MHIYRRYLKYSLLMLFSCVTALVLYWCVANEQTHTLRVYFLDVGQGDAVFVVAPNGNTLLYDSGPPGDALLRELDLVFPKGERTLDVVVASHPDADHIGGFTNLKTRYSIGRYVDTRYFHPSVLFADTQEYISSRSNERRRVGETSYIALGGGVFIVLSQVPSKDADANNGSIIMQVKYGDSRILCTGDMDSSAEERLVEAYGPLLRSTILKAGHHGAKTSNSERLLQAVSPKDVVVSSGKNNSYGHPHLPALTRMIYIGANIHQTAKEGTVAFVCTRTECTKKSSK